MKELKEIASAKMSSMIEDGSIEKMIDDNLGNAVQDAVKSAFNYSSEFTKVLKEKVQEAINSACDNIKLPAYNKYISSIIEEQFMTVLKEDAVKHLAREVGEIIEPVKATAKMSELMDAIGELWGDEAREEGKEEIEIDCRTNDDETAMYVTIKNPIYEHNDVKVTFYNFNRSGEEDKGWHIGYINVDGEAMTGGSLNFAKTAFGGLANLLFKYYAMSTRFELDTGIDSIYVSGY